MLRHKGLQVGNTHERGMSSVLAACCIAGVFLTLSYTFSGMLSGQQQMSRMIWGHATAARVSRSAMGLVSALVQAQFLVAEEDAALTTTTVALGPGLRLDPANPVTNNSGNCGTYTAPVPAQVPQSNTDVWQFISGSPKRIEIDICNPEFADIQGNCANTDKIKTVISFIDSDGIQGNHKIVNAEVETELDKALTRSKRNQKVTYNVRFRMPILTSIPNNANKQCLIYVYRRNFKSQGKGTASLWAWDLFVPPPADLDQHFLCVANSSAYNNNNGACGQPVTVNPGSWNPNYGYGGPQWSDWDNKGWWYGYRVDRQLTFALKAVDRKYVAASGYFIKNEEMPQIFDYTQGTNADSCTYKLFQPTPANASTKLWAANTMDEVLDWCDKDRNGGQSDCNCIVSGRISPLMIDMAGEGIRFTGLDNMISFDMGEGRLSYSWPSNPRSAKFLAQDLNSNGRIDDVGELFGNRTRGPKGETAETGFEALAKWDDNNDRVIDASDGIFKKLLLWSDFDTDGKTDDGELAKLSDSAVRSISLDYESRVNNWTGNGGVSLQEAATFMENGQKRTIYDVWFTLAK